MLLARAQSQRILAFLIIAAYLWIGAWANLGHNHYASSTDKQVPAIAEIHKHLHPGHSECHACAWILTATAITVTTPVSIANHILLTDNIPESALKSIQRPNSSSTPRAPPV